MDAMNHSPGVRRSRAFTLIELLLVIGVAVVLMALMAPAFTSITTGSRLNQAGQLVGDVLSLARQEAVSRNREVQVRFYQLDDDDTPGWRAVQAWMIEQGDSGAVETPITRLQILPVPMLIAESAALSPLITSPSVSGTSPVAGRSGGPYAYAGVRFRPTGGLGQSTGGSFLTIHSATDSGSPPQNYYTLQINPITGRLDVYRP